MAGLVLSGNTVYGTTSLGGYNDFGTVFGFNISNDTFTFIYNFGGQISDDGAYPCTELLLISNILYGTTSSGGSNNCGTVFAINLTNPYQDKILYNFLGKNHGDGDDPQGALILSGGILYGTTEAGGNLSDQGTVFSINLSSGQHAILHNFNDDHGDGKNPLGGLVISGNILYGTTSDGGTNIGGGGTVYAMNLNNTNQFSVLHSFDPYNTNDAANPCSNLSCSRQHALRHREFRWQCRLRDGL